MSDQQLRDKVAIVTGASRGIGQKIAETFAEAGAKVVLVSRKREGLDAVASGIQSKGGTTLVVPANVDSEAAAQDVVGQAITAYGGVDILVNNAGANPHFGPILTAEDSHWVKTFDVNVRASFWFAKAVADSMKSRGGGKIIIIASTAGKTPQPGMGVYCVSKAAAIMLTEVLALELAPYNIQVNAIAPGFVKTKFSSALWTNEKLLEKITRFIPLKRIAMPEEVAGTALYLASSASSYVTGTTLVVDGGQLLASPIS